MFYVFTKVNELCFAANPLDESVKNRAKLAYVKKKQYLCDRKGFNPGRLLIMAKKKLLLFVTMCLMALSMTAQTTPYVIYDYLKVFPNDLGTFEAEPKTIIARLNQNQQYGYGTWRLPTNEELALMKANNVIGDGSYMTRENKRGIVRLVTDKEQGDTIPALPQGYVDLGLPSGTLWKDQNEIAGLYTYEQAMEKFGNELPTKEQLEELQTSCRWTWTGSSYRVEGPNGNHYAACGRPPLWCHRHGALRRIGRRLLVLYTEWCGGSMGSALHFGGSNNERLRPSQRSIRSPCPLVFFARQPV